MEINEGLELLKTAPCDDKPSKVNKSLTRLQVVEITRKALESTRKHIGKKRQYCAG